jgi:hypothetical protein
MNESTNTQTPATPAVTPDPKDGSAVTSAPVTAPANAAPNAPAVADPASTAPVADAGGSLDNTDDESDTEKEVLAIAREKARLRSERDKVKDRLSLADKLEKAQEFQKAGDYVAAIEAMGWDPDDFYVKSTDQIVKRDKKVVDPVEVARAEARAAVKEATEAQAKAANEIADRRWVSNVDLVLDSDYDKYPNLTRALATGRVTRDDMLKYAYGRHNTKLDSSPEAVSRAIEDHLATQAAKSKPKVTPAAKGNGAPAPAEAPAAAGTNPPPSALGSNAPAKIEVEDTGNVDENFKRALAKFGFQSTV